MELAPKGLNEDTVRYISAKKGEPEWMLAVAARSFPALEGDDRADLGDVNYPKIDYQDAHYYAAPEGRREVQVLDGRRSGNSGHLRQARHSAEGAGSAARRRGGDGEAAAARETPRVAVDAVFDSVSVATTFRAELLKAGVIFMSISEASASIPDLVKKYLGSVVPVTDNFFATLNSGVFGRDVCLRAARACAARWSCRPISA
jgi:Fe-S cluster assembly protein SufB